MVWQYSPYAASSAGAGLISLCVALYAYRRRSVPGGRAFCLLMLAVGYYALANAIELSSVDIPQKIFWSQVSYVGIVSLAPLWIIFTALYTRRDQGLSRGRIAGLWVVPVLVFGLVLTNEWHGWIWPRVQLLPGRPTIAFYDHGPGVWLMVVYAYLLMAVGTVWLLQFAWRSPGVYRNQALALVFASLCPWLGNALYVLELNPFRGLDLTPFALTATGLLLAYNLSRLHLLDLMPVAHSTLFAHLGDGVLVVDNYGRMVDFNPAAQRLLGLSARDIGQPAEAALTNCPELLLPPDTPPGESQQSREVACGSLWWDVLTTPLVARNGRASGRLIVMHDITQRRLAEEALRESEERFRAIFETARDPIYIKDIDLRYRLVNPAFTELYNTSADEIIGQVFTEATGVPLIQAVSQTDARVLAGEIVEEELEFAGAGPMRIFHVIKTPMRDAAGLVSGLCAIARDVTERKRAEDNQRLAAVGQLAAGVAHEFNNLLAAMLMRAERTAISTNPEDSSKLVGLVIRSCLRGSDICRNLTAFARPHEPQREVMYVEAAIEGALNMALRQLESAGCNVRRDFLSDGRMIYADQGQLEQVFLNLFINAAHAMPQGGVLTIRTRFQPSESGPGEMVITVADTGMGIEAGNLAHIFEPFFTTKGRLGESDTPGTGLGLSVSHGIIRAHGGSITVQSREGEGTTFELRFAVRELQPSAASQEETADDQVKSPHRLGLRLLVVEDEEDLRELIAEILRADGHEVVTAEDAPQATAALNAAPFDMVITDLVMGAGGGREVLSTVGTLRYAPPVLIVTGRADGHIVAELERLGAARILHKPFGPQALVDAVREVSEAAQPKWQPK